MKTYKQQLKEALQNGTLYDFISNNGYGFSKDDLICIIKNLDYAVYTEYGENACLNVEKATIEALNDYDFFKE